MRLYEYDPAEINFSLWQTCLGCALKHFMMTVQKQSNAEKCRKRRLKLLEADPHQLELQRENDRKRAKKNRDRQRTPEEMQRLRELGLARQKRYLEKKKAEKEALAAQGLPSPPKTRKKAEQKAVRRETVRVAVEKHRSLQSSQKKRRVRAKRMAYYYKKKEEKEAKLHRQNSKSTQSAPPSDCPYPTMEAYKRGVKRVAAKLKARGAKLAYLCKGILRNADKEAQEKLKELNVTFSSPPKNTPSPRKTLASHMEDIKNKRDASTLNHKRVLANAFKKQGSTSHEQIGLSKRFVNATKRPLYKRNGNVGHDTVRKFYNTNSHPDPCKKTSKRQLLKPVKELYKEFQRQYPGLKMSLRTFHRQKPSNVASVKRAKFRQCLCEVCLNPKLKLKTVNRFLKDKCDCVRDLLIESVCEFEDFPRRECVERKCGTCGVEKVKERLLSELGGHVHESVSWAKWEHVKEGRASRMDKVKKRGSLGECVEELIKEIVSLYMHVYVAEWQRKQIQSLKENLPHGCALVTVDFAENFLCKFQDEPQSAHWAYKQVALFPAVIFSRCSSDGCEEVKREEIAFFSDDLLKDAHLTQACIDQICVALKDRMGSQLKKIVIASDGCAAQFKSKLPFLLFSRMNVSGVEVEKFFFGSRHGKNDSDWSGGAIKRSVTRDVAAGIACIRSAKEMHEHCMKTLSMPDGPGCHHKTRRFVLVDGVERPFPSSSVDTVVGSRGFHHVRALGPGVLAARDLACFCQACRVGRFTLCTSPNVRPWKEIQMKYSLPEDFSESEPDSEPEAEHSASDSDSGSDQPAVIDSDACVSSDESDVSGSEDQVNLDDAFVESFACSDNLDQAFIESDTLGYEERQHFFQAAADALSACASFESLQQKSFDLKEAVLEHQIPDTSPELLSHPRDQHAHSLLSEDIKNRCSALQVGSDGNCFFRAVSLLLFGNEEGHLEMRVRIVIEMCTRERVLLDGKQWSPCYDGLSPEQVMELAVQTSATPQGTPQSSFRNEALVMSRTGSYAGVWQFFALSLLLNRPVQSVYPLLGWPVFQTHCNRVIRAPGCTSNEPLLLLWTSSRNDMVNEHWVPNHFVSLVMLDQSVFPKLGSTYTVKWGGSVYPCQILETDRLLHLVCVKFMKKSKNGLWFWGQRDVSWEPLSSLVKEITLKIIDRVSNQRCQFFSV